MPQMLAGFIKLSIVYVFSELSHGIWDGLSVVEETKFIPNVPPLQNLLISTVGTVGYIL